MISPVVFSILVSTPRSLRSDYLALQLLFLMLDTGAETSLGYNVLDFGTTTKSKLDTETIAEKSAAKTGGEKI